MKFICNIIFFFIIISEGYSIALPESVDLSINYYNHSNCNNHTIKTSKITYMCFDTNNKVDCCNDLIDRLTLFKPNYGNGNCYNMLNYSEYYSCKSSKSSNIQIFETFALLGLIFLFCLILIFIIFSCPNIYQNKYNKLYNYK